MLQRYVFPDHVALHSLARVGAGGSGTKLERRAHVPFDAPLQIDSVNGDQARHRLR
jgi:hypothetical protein